MVIPKDSWIFQHFKSWWMEMHHPAAHKQREVKMRGAVLLTAATVAGGKKNAHIERVKKMSSGKFKKIMMR
jgi:hypothetical protein